MAILEALVRLTNEVSKLAVVKSQPPRRQYKSRSPSPRHAASQANLDYAIITDVLALKHGDAECLVRSQTRET